MEEIKYDSSCKLFAYSRSSRPEVFCKNGVLRNFAKFTGKHLCQNLFFNKVAGLRPATLLKRETLAQVFSFEFCEISKNTFSYRTPPVAASVTGRSKFDDCLQSFSLKEQTLYSPVIN